ncbi:hypothetical protein [Cryobacterium sp. Y82]|nr:hypothetical protein [Cryobacterium sp. Y82]
MWLDVVPVDAVDSANGTPLHSQVGTSIRSRSANMRALVRK